MDQSALLQMLCNLLLQRFQKRRRILIDNMLRVENDIVKNIEKNKQRKQINNIVTCNGTLPQMFFTTHIPRFRQIGSLTRCESYWWTLQQPGNEKLYFESFRMRKETFNLLCHKLASLLKTKTQFATPSIPVEKQVAICLYKLASAAEYRVVGDVFGIHKSTVHKYFHIVIEAIIDIKSEFMKFPDLHNCLQISREFESISHIPNIVGAIDGVLKFLLLYLCMNIVGAIDGTHIPILPPEEGRLDYINRKGWPSIVLQVVVAHDYKFIDVSIKHPGSTHDASVFKESGLYRNYSRIIPQYSTLLNNIHTPLFLIGDPAYPLMSWLMKPYVGKLTPEEESFNVHLSSARIRVENAIGRLKGRWRCICKRIDVDPEFVPKVVVSCAMMHNFVENNKEVYLDIWSGEARNLEIDYPQPNREISNATYSDPHNNPNVIRNNLKAYLKNNFPLRTSHNCI